VLIDDYFG